MFQFLWDIFAENYVNDIKKKKTRFILLENDFWDNSSKVLVLNHFNPMLGTLTSYQLDFGGHSEKLYNTLKIVIHYSFFTIVPQVSL